MVPPKRVTLCHQQPLRQSHFGPTRHLSTKALAAGCLRTDAVAPVGDFGTKIRWIRSSTAMDQTGFAEAVGISRKTVGSWENEDVAPQRSNLKLLASYLDIPVDELVAFLAGSGRLVTIPAPMRHWFDVPRISNETTLGELSKLAGGSCG